jgi:hypothetical protein
MDIDDTGIASTDQLSRLCKRLPKQFKPTKYGASEAASELYDFTSFDDVAYQDALRRNTGFFVLRMTGYIVNFMFGDHDFPNLLSIRTTARDFDKKVKAIDDAWRYFTPDAQGFYNCYTGYAAHGALGYDQDDSEYVNRFSHTVKYPTYHAATGEYLYDSGQDMNALRYLDLLPGLTWRIAMGERYFEKYNISPEEISKFCVSTEETTAANGDKLWKFQSREDPLDWRDSYERQLKLNRPDVFFDIAPLRERFSEPADIKDSGRGKELEKLFKTALIELYPEAATKDISV